MKFLVQQKQDFNQVNEDGLTPLMITCFQKTKTLKIFKQVLKVTQNVNSQDKNGFSALHYAALANNISIIKALIQKKGVNVHLKNTRGETFDLISKDKAKIQILLKNIQNKKKEEKKVNSSLEPIFSPDSSSEVSD